MWTLAGGNLSEDDCEDGGDHFQDFDGNDDGNDDEDIVPPIAQSESTDQWRCCDASGTWRRGSKMKTMR